MKEPRITINGDVLTDAQALTMRCAIESFAMDLHADGCGDNAHGRTMTAGYLALIDEIRALMRKP